MNELGISTPDRDRFSIACPLHHEQNGQSFSVERKNGTWLFNCFGKCGCGGDEITFLERHRSVSNDEAIKIYLQKIPSVDKEVDEGLGSLFRTRVHTREASGYKEPTPSGAQPCHVLSSPCKFVSCDGRASFDFNLPR
jgi:DNA primase